MTRRDVHRFRIRLPGRVVDAFALVGMMSFFYVLFVFAAGMEWL